MALWNPLDAAVTVALPPMTPFSGKEGELVCPAAMVVLAGALILPELVVRLTVVALVGAGIIVTLTELEPPALIARGPAGEKCRGDGTILKVKVELLVRAPEVPFTVTVEEPGLAVADAVIVNWPLVLPAGIVSVPGLGVTPKGRPVKVAEIVPLNPPPLVTLTVSVPCAPGANCKGLGLGAKLNEGVTTEKLEVSLV